MNSQKPLRGWAIISTHTAYRSVSLDVPAALPACSLNKSWNSANPATNIFTKSFLQWATGSHSEKHDACVLYSFSLLGQVYFPVVKRPIWSQIDVKLPVRIKCSDISTIVLTCSILHDHIIITYYLSPHTNIRQWTLNLINIRKAEISIRLKPLRCPRRASSHMNPEAGFIFIFINADPNNCSFLKYNWLPQVQQESHWKCGSWGQRWRPWATS